MWHINPRMNWFDIIYFYYLFILIPLIFYLNGHEKKKREEDGREMNGWKEFDFIKIQSIITLEKNATCKLNKKERRKEKIIIIKI